MPEWRVNGSLRRLLATVDRSGRSRIAGSDR